MDHWRAEYSERRKLGSGEGRQKRTMPMVPRWRPILPGGNAPDRLTWGRWLEGDRNGCVRTQNCWWPGALSVGYPFPL